MKEEQERVEKYWKLYKESKDEQAREILMNTYLPLVKTIAAKTYRRRADESSSFQDMLHYGTVGLLDAIDKFLLEKKTDFKTYAKYRIEGEIYDGLSQASEVASQISARKKIVQQRVQSLSENQITQSTLEKLLEQAVGVAIGFMLDSTVIYQENDFEQQDTPYCDYSLKELKQNIRKAMLDLPENQKKILDLHYVQGLNFSDIAKMMSLSRSRISQLHKESLLKLKLTIIHFA